MSAVDDANMEITEKQLFTWLFLPPAGNLIVPMVPKKERKKIFEFAVSKYSKEDPNLVKTVGEFLLNAKEISMVEKTAVKQMVKMIIGKSKLQNFDENKIPEDIKDLYNLLKSIPELASLFGFGEKNEQ